MFECLQELAAESPDRKDPKGLLAPPVLRVKPAPKARPDLPVQTV